MITTTCDLACPGCDRFIDQEHNWTEPYDAVTRNMTEWSKRLTPNNVTLIGGEPLIHPNISNIIAHTRKTWPEATIEIMTNGFMFTKREDFLEIMQANTPGLIGIAIHNREKTIRNILMNNIDKYIFKKALWKQIDHNTWEHNGLRVQIYDMTRTGWYQYRRVVGGVLKPWRDNDPESSYKHCGVATFPIIYKNRLYKCPPISMLNTHATKYNLLEDEDWKPYLEYQGLDIDCREDELNAFVDNITQHHKICGMCPANPIIQGQEEAVIKNKKYYEV